ncbi:sodium:calcium antiporter [soil metagenome]
MLAHYALLALALVLIVAAAEMFTNGIEWLGQRLGLSEGVVGSLLAAVGTALPETLIPIVAVFFFGGKHGADVGVGAIAGAPFMLSTLTLALCGLSMFVFSRTGRRKQEMKINNRLLTRDLCFFIVAYGLALGASFMSPDRNLRLAVATGIFLIYPFYVYMTITGESEMGDEPEQLYLAKVFKLDSRRLVLIIPQIVISLVGIVGGAALFVDHIETIAKGIGFSALFLSLIISPIATELPEKINSILWARAGKDTLALANITGALVFQACFPVAFGVAFTSWDLEPKVISSGIVAILSAMIFLRLISTNQLKPVHLMCGAFAYVVVIGVIIMTDTVDPMPISLIRHLPL